MKQKALKSAAVLLAAGTYLSSFFGSLPVTLIGLALTITAIEGCVIAEEQEEEKESARRRAREQKQAQNSLDDYWFSSQLTREKLLRDYNKIKL